MDFRRKHGVDGRLARIFNTYGPRMALDDGRVVSNFIVQALRGEPLTIYGDGSQTRSFCYVDDLVDGLVRLMEHPDEPGPVNLGNPGEFTIAELAEEVIALTGARSALVREPLPADDPRQWRSPGFVDIPGSVIGAGGLIHGKTQATYVHREVQGRRGSSRDGRRQDDRRGGQAVRPDRDRTSRVG